MALRPKLSSAERQEEARALLDRMRFFELRSGFVDHIANMSRWDVLWRGTQARLNKPWAHASEYVPPIILSKIEDLHSVIFSFFSNFNFFQMAASSKATDEADEVMQQRAEMWTDLLRWSLEVESNSISFIDRFIHDGLLFGSGFGFLPWMRASRKTRTEMYMPDELRSERKMSDRSVIKACLGETLLSKQLEGGEDEGYSILFIDEDGEEKDAKAWVDRDNPYRPEGEPVVIIQRDVCWYNAPRPQVINPWDILVPPDARDLQTARRFWVRDFIDMGEMARLSSVGIFNTVTKKELELIKPPEAGGGSPVVSGIGIRDIPERTRDKDLGQQFIMSRRDLVEIHYEYAHEDLDGDGQTESIVRAVAMGRKPILIMRHPVEYLYPHGKRPFFDWHFIPINGRYYGMGVAELLERTQEEGSAYYRARSDAVEIITKPGGMYDPMSGLAPNEIRFTPGMMVKARDPRNAFTPFVFASDPGILLREQSGIEGQAEKAVGSTDMGLGRSSSRPNAPRTLGGTAIVVRQQQLRTDVYLKRCMFGSNEFTGGIVEFLSQYRDLYSALMPADKEFRVLGSNEIRRVSRSDLRGRFDFLVDFGPEINNPQLRLQNAQTRYQNALTNPLIMQNPQALWKITIDFLESTGMKNPARSLPPPIPGQEHPPMEQEEENYIMSKGQSVKVLPMDDHKSHLAVIAELLHNPMLLARQFHPGTLPLLNDHAQQHMQAMMASASGQMMSGQGAGSPGMSMGANLLSGGGPSMLGKGTQQAGFAMGTPPVAPPAPSQIPQGMEM